MLTKLDLQQIGKLVKAILTEELFDLREEVKKIKLLPTRDEFFKKMDEVITELQKERDDHTVMRGQLGDHEERMEKIEKKLHISP